MALYLLALFSLVALLVCGVGPRWGQRSPFVYIGITACLGSVTVMCCIALGIGFTQSFVQVEEYVRSRWGNWSTFSEKFAHIIHLTGAGGAAGPSQVHEGPPVLLVLALFVLTAVCIVLQMYYLNRALDLFSVNLVTPLLYVFFTIAVLALSAILFKEWGKLSFTSLASILCGFANIVFGIFLLSCFKHLDVGLLLFAMDSQRATAASAKGRSGPAPQATAGSDIDDRDDLSTWKQLLHMMAFGGDLPGSSRSRRPTESERAKHEPLPPPRENARSEVRDSTPKTKTKASVTASTPSALLGASDSICLATSGSDHIEESTYGSLKSNTQSRAARMNETRLHHQITSE